VDVEVDRRNLHHTRLVQHPARDLAPGEVRLAVEHFALTSNNVSYAAFGDALRYWEFFPPAPVVAGDPAEWADVEWGRVPVWGFATVVESRHDDVAIGRRLYGYLPMSDELVVLAGKVDDRGLIDVAEHRRGMATAYNRYTFTDTDPAYEAAREHHRMVLFPLFFTSWLVDDFFGDHDLFGAELVVISSASSKTAIGAARLFADRPGVRVVGLTSPGNHAFVAGLDCYHDVVDYDVLDALPEGDAVFVDIAGNADVRVAVHRHYGDRLAHSMIVGGTHWDHRPATDAGPLPGPTPAFFFAPNQIAKRAAEWGQDGVDERLGAAWRRCAAWADGWIRFDVRRGAAAVEAAFAELVNGDIDPTVGIVGVIEE
jgi:hypothetical protein